MSSIKTFRSLAALAAILLSFSFAAAQINAPAPLPGDAAPAVAAGRQENPQIARGANGYLAVWADTRTAIRGDGVSVGFAGPYDGTGIGSMVDIYAARLDANGNLIDQTPIIVNEAQYNQGYPRVAWNGQNWLVVWLTEHENNRYAYDLLGARVAPDGTVLDQTPIVLKANSSAQVFSQNLIVDGAGNWLAVWEGFSTTTTRSVYVARVAPDGTVLDPNGRAIYNHNSQYLTNPDLAFAGDSYLLTFVDLASGPNFENLVKGVRLSAALTPVSAPFRINTNANTHTQKARVSSNGTDYLVVWPDDPGSITVIRGARVGHTGQLLDATPLEIAPNAGIRLPTVNVTWDGAVWHVAYDSDYDPRTGDYNDMDIYDTRVSGAGAVLDPVGISVSNAPGSQNEVGIAPGTGGGARFVWFDQQVELDVYSGSVSATGTAGASVPVGLGAPRQTRPRMAAGGTGFLAVYRTETAGVGRVLAQRLDANGAGIDNTPLVVAVGPQSVNNPSVAWNGAEFLVVWHVATDTGQQTFGRRVSAAGEFIDAAPFFIMKGETPDVAALGDTFLVTNILQATTQLRYVQALRVSSAGALLGSPVTLQFNFNNSPRVAAVGNRWLAVWQFRARHDSSVTAINGAFVNPDGTSAGNISVGGSGAAPHLASAGGTALIAWQSGNDIVARRVQADGTFLDPVAGFPVTNAANLQTSPAVAWDGAQYVLDWIDQRNETYPIQPRGDIYGARVSATGIVVEEFTLANSALPEETPFVAAAAGQIVFAYAKFYDVAPYAAYHITLRTARFAAPGGGSIPVAPTSLAATRSYSNGVSLTWADNSTDELGFKVETSSASTGPWTQFATVGANVTTLNNVSVGSTQVAYFRVRAYNVAGDSAYSNITSPPYVYISSPAYNTTYNAPATVNVTAAPYDDDGTITKVEFYARTGANAPALIGTATAAPFNITWTNVPANNYYLSAVAIDNQGQPTTSAEVLIIVQSAYLNLSGHVTTAAGAPIEGVIVTLSVGQTATATTDAAGFYAFNGLTPSGSYFTVIPAKAGYSFEPGYEVFSAGTRGDQTTDFRGYAAAGGQVVISEFRTRGPAGAQDEFVELYNNTDADIVVSTTDGSAGWAVVAEVSDLGVQTPLYVIPNGTTLRARAHFLLTNATASNGYSLSMSATGDATYARDIADTSGVSLFRTANPSAFSLSNRLDGVGFVGNNSAYTAAYREGTGLTPIGTAVGADEQFSFVRRQSGGTPQDTGDNAADFILVSMTGTVSGAQVTLGTPGAESAASPLQRNTQIKAALVDPQAASTAAPNRVRDLTPVANGALGTLIIRRKFTNKTGAPVTALRFRIVDITTAPAPAGTADMRLLDSADTNVALTTGTTIVRGTKVEIPQATGGGLNSTGVIALPGGALSNGASVNVQFVLGIQQGGAFRFVVNVEALTNTPTGAPAKATTAGTK